jgi:flagellar assembly protein FliH
VFEAAVAMNMSSRIIRTSTGDTETVAQFKFTPAFPSGHAPKPPSAPAAHGSLFNVSAASDPDGLRQQCEMLLVEAQMKASEIEKEAYEKGFAEGQEAAAGIVEKSADGLLKQYSATLGELDKLRREILASCEREVIRLALEVAKKIIKREVAIDDELVLALVKVALSRVADQALITIRVNPKDRLVIERHNASRADRGLLSEAVKVIDDPLIGRGGCVIETESGTIDARIEEQMREIEKGFFE